MSPRFLIKLEFMLRGKDIQACHRLKDSDRAIEKFNNRKYSLQVFRVKKNLRSFEPTEFDFPECLRILMNKSVCAYYRGLWNKYKKFKKYR